MKRPPWLTQILLDSAMIVFSILLALWMNDWEQDREKERLAGLSLLNFLKEVQRNESWLEDVAPFHLGMATAMKQQAEAGAIRTPEDLFNMVGLEGVRPPDLLDTAWQTAIATGALTHMDYETVSALSLTYTQQARFREDVRNGLPEALRTGNVRHEDVPSAVHSVNVFLQELTRNEQQLQAVYAQAASVIRDQLRVAHPDLFESLPADTSDANTPPADSNPP